MWPYWLIVFMYFHCSILIASIQENFSIYIGLQKKKIVICANTKKIGNKLGGAIFICHFGDEVMCSSEPGCNRG